MSEKPKIPIKKIERNTGSFEMIKLLRWEKVQSYFTNIYGVHVTFSEL